MNGCFLHTADAVVFFKQVIKRPHQKYMVIDLIPQHGQFPCIRLFGTDIDGFVEDYESSVYGGKGDEKADCSAVYTEFAAAYKAKLKEERKRRKK